MRMNASRSLLLEALRHPDMGLSASPAEVMCAAQASAPSPLVLRLMDTLVLQALVSCLPEVTNWRNGLACWLLYVRSHALRMPPWLLVGHLFCKSLRLWTMLLQRKHAS